MSLFVAPLVFGLIPSDNRSIPIAPGVRMPLINMGASLNQTLWLEEGGRGMDTALTYGDQAEAAVAQAVSLFEPRDELFVTTKIPCCPSPFDRSVVHSCPSLGLDPDKWIDHTLKALGLDGAGEFVDLMLLHWPCDTPEQTLNIYRAMEAAKDRGQVKNLGISNFNASTIDALLQGGLKHRPVINQCGYSIGGHAPTETRWGRDEPTRAKSLANNITYSAYSPLGGVTKIDVLHNPTVLAVAADHGVNAAQVALRWVVQRGVPAVTNSDSAGHMQSDLAIFDFELTDEEMERLAKV
jgi:diketogulonate reductase-like aldo/keto reductase